MDESFDPYRKWLGIRTAERPPDHYQLLGLQAFEDDPETISHAADQRIAYVRTLAVNDYVDASQRVLNELAAAKVSLLNREKKAIYDERLYARRASGTNLAAASASAALSASTTRTSPTSHHAQRPAAPPQRIQLQSIAARFRPRWRHVIGVACGGLLLLAGLALAGLFSREPSDGSERRVSQQAAVAPPEPTAERKIGQSRKPFVPKTKTDSAVPDTSISDETVSSPPSKATSSTASIDTKSSGDPDVAAPTRVDVGLDADRIADLPNGATAGSGAGDASSRPATELKSASIPDEAVQQDARPLSPVQEYKGHQGPVTALGFGGDGQSFVSAGTDSKLLVWKIGTATPYSTLSGESSPPESVALSPQGTHIVCVTGRGDNVNLWELARSRITKSIRGVYRQAAFTPDGQGIFCVKRDEVEGWSLLSGQTVQKIMRFNDDPLKTDWCWCGDLSQDGTRAITAGDGVISLWDLNKRKNSSTGEVGTQAIKHVKLPKDMGVSQIRFLFDGRHVVSLSGDQYGRRQANSGLVKYWDLETGLEIAASNKLPKAVQIVACTDRLQIFLGGVDGNLYIDRDMRGDANSIMASNARSLWIAGPRARPSPCLAASSDGEILLTGGVDGVIRQWDVSELLTSSNAPGASQSKAAEDAAVVARFAAPFETAKAKRADAKDTDGPKTGKRTMSTWLSQFEENYRTVYEPADEPARALASAAANAIIEAGRGDAKAFDEIVARFETLIAPPFMTGNNSGGVHHAVRLLSEGVSASRQLAVLHWILSDKERNDHSRNWLRGWSQARWGSLDKLNQVCVYAAVLATIGEPALGFARNSLRNKDEKRQHCAIAVLSIWRDCHLRFENGDGGDYGSLVRVLTEMLAHENKQYRFVAVSLLCDLGETASPAVDALLAGIRSGDLISEIGNDELPSLLSKIGGSAKPLLLELLRFRLAENRGGGPPQGSDADGAVRAKAAQCLGKRKEYRSDDVVLALTAAIADAPARQNAVIALGKLGPAAQSALPVLERLAADPATPPKERVWITLAIKKIQ